MSAPASAEEDEPYVSGWLPDWSMTRSLRAVTDHPELFGAASPFWYSTRSASRIDPRPGAEDPDVLEALRRAGVPVIPTVIAPITPEAMSEILTDPSARRTHVAVLVDLVISRGYDGIDLDYEHFAVTDDPDLIAANRDGYSALVSELCPELRARGRLCVVTVMARTNDANQASHRPELGVGVFDYRALGAAVDRLRVMAYDHHYPTGSPGPVAGYRWVEEVIHYTVARVPPWKVELGVASYGYDWGSSGTRARSRTTVAMQDFAAEMGVTPSWSAEEREHTFSYLSAGVGHTVWYQDARSLRERVVLGGEHCLGGVTMWTTGGADEAMWNTLQRLAGGYPSAAEMEALSPPTVGDADEISFYREDGLFRFYQARPDGSLPTPLLAGDGYTAGWDSITAVDLDGDGKDEMFFYREDGVFRFYDIRPDGTLPSPMLAGDGYTTGWDAISAVDLDGDGRDEMFFYREDGLFRFYEVRPDGSLPTPLLAGDGYTAGWDSITAVDLDGDGKDEMFFYREDGVFRFYDIRPDGTLPSPMLAGDGYTTGWDAITAVDLDGDGQDEMFFYREDGLFRYYHIRPDGSLPSPLLEGDGYTTGWSAITAVNLDGGPCTGHHPTSR